MNLLLHIFFTVFLVSKFFESLNPDVSPNPRPWVNPLSLCWGERPPARPHAMALNLLAGVLSETKLNGASAPAQEALAISQRLKDKDLEAWGKVGRQSAQVRIHGLLVSSRFN